MKIAHDEGVYSSVCDISCPVKSLPVWAGHRPIEFFWIWRAVNEEFVSTNLWIHFPQKGFHFSVSFSR